MSWLHSWEQDISAYSTDRERGFHMIVNTDVERLTGHRCLLRCSRWVKVGRQADVPDSDHAVTGVDGFRIESPGILSSIR